MPTESAYLHLAQHYFCFLVTWYTYYHHQHLYPIQSRVRTSVQPTVTAIQQQITNMLWFCF